MTTAFDTTERGQFGVDSGVRISAARGVRTNGLRTLSSSTAPHSLGLTSCSSPCDVNGADLSWAPLCPQSLGGVFHQDQFFWEGALHSLGAARISWDCHDCEVNVPP